MNVAIIVQARMTSTRLPGKVLMPVLNKPLLAYQLERLARLKNAQKLVVATTTNESDDPIIELCQQLGVDYFRGSEHDVLSRYYHAALQVHADVVVRICSDCPLIDPVVTDRVIAHFLENFPAYDYVSNCLVRTYPRGLDTEVFSFKVLEQAFYEAKQEPEREHVTPFIWRQPAKFKLGSVVNETDLSNHRWTVDTPQDFLLIENIIKNLYPAKPCFGMTDVFALLHEYPAWMLLNAGVEQKHV